MCYCYRKLEKLVIFLSRPLSTPLSASFHSPPGNLIGLEWKEAKKGVERGQEEWKEAKRSGRGRERGPSASCHLSCDLSDVLKSP